MARETITYTNADMEWLGMHESRPAHVAANALYLAAELKATDSEQHHDVTTRNEILYVGRLVTEKKPDLLIKAFARVAEQLDSVSLHFVGTGNAEGDLRALADSLNVSRRVHFHGQINELAELRVIYSSAYVSVSPGYVGLSLTQSLGFGVPMIIANDEPHAPEYELASVADACSFFPRDDDLALAREIVDVYAQRAMWLASATEASKYVAAHYSVESMIAGFVSAASPYVRLREEIHSG